MKQHRTKLLLSSLVCLLPLIAGLLLWNQLPAEIATHFTGDNVPDRYSGKAFAVVGFPLLLLLIHWLCLFATLHDPKKANLGSKMLALVFWIVPLASCVACGSLLLNALGRAVNIGLTVHLMMGVLFLLIGNYLGKTHQNYTVGIKLPWTLNSTENWNRTHRLASRCFIIGGLVLLLNGWLLSTALLLAVVLVCALIPAVYSYALYKKGI